MKDQYVIQRTDGTYITSTGICRLLDSDMEITKTMTNVSLSVLRACVDATRAARQRIAVVREDLAEDGYGTDGKLLSNLDSADAYLSEVMGQLKIIIRDAK